MIRQTYQIDIITPCFCGGAEPEKQAEIRAPSIRGQLRWWFRVLGGFKSLAHLPLPEQENLIFGSTAGAEGTAGKLAVRVTGPRLVGNVVDDEAMKANPGSDRGYLLFPLRPEKKGKPEERRRDRAVLNERAEKDSGHSFGLQFLWRDSRRLDVDLMALESVFANLGSLGFRSRRSMGALAPAKEVMEIHAALARFNLPGNIQLFTLPASGPADSILQHARWLKSWRAHGRSGQNEAEKSYPGFDFAKSDHDLALRGGTATGFRPALGLPLLTKYGNWNAEKPSPGKQTAGRFASPVILRPHRDSNGQWHALVIFIDARKWNAADPVFLNGVKKSVSLDLYDAMKADPALKPFP